MLPMLPLARLIDCNRCRAVSPKVSSHACSESHWQRLQTSQGEVAIPFQIFILQPELRHATENGVDSYLSFETSQGRTHAIVQTVSEGEVPVWFASEVEFVSARQTAPGRDCRRQS